MSICLLVSFALHLNPGNYTPWLLSRSYPLDTSSLAPVHPGETIKNVSSGQVCWDMLAITALRAVEA
jgi:hypothetical protein